MKPHLILVLAPGIPYREVGSWIDLLGDPGVAGPPFQHDVDAVLARHRVDAAVVHEHDPAGTGGWSPAERAAGLDRMFRIIAVAAQPFPTAFVDALRALPVAERVTEGLIAVTPLPLASSLSRRPSDWAAEAVALEEARRASLGDPAVTIAVLDTGVSPRHPEYANRLLPGFDAVDIIDGAEEFVGDRIGADRDASDPGVGHGSHVTGILVAGGARMMRGVAPRCRVLPVRVLGALRRGERLIGAGLVDNIDCGIKWAVDHGADVINMSLGIRHEGGGLPHTRVIRYARARGVSVVAAAGNDGAATLYYPGALPGVLAVGAVDRDGRVAGYSTWGDQVDIVAPGTEIWSSWLGDAYGFASGTSQATPFVAGAAALCQSVARARGTRLDPGQIAHVLQMTADRADRHFKSSHAGFGRLNVADALTLTDHLLGERAPRRRPELVPA